MATGRIGTTPVLQVRWSKAPSAGTTSLSGLDDNSVSLVYSVGYEAVYRNGVLLSRTNDYTATDGTTVTLIDATIAGDIIEIFANQTIPLADTYSQTVANGKFINNTLTTTTGDIIYASAANTPARLGIGSTDQVLKVSGGIPAWGAAPAAGFVGCVLTKSVGQTIANSTNVDVTWDTESLDTNGFHSTVTNTDRITIPSGYAGKYLVVAQLSYGNNATGDLRRSLIFKNTTQLSYANVRPNRATPVASFIADMAVGDYFKAVANQDSGGDLTLEGNNFTQGASVFYVTYLGV